MSKTNETQVRLRKTTITNLKKLGKMGESYNDVIDRMIQELMK